MAHQLLLPVLLPTHTRAHVRQLARAPQRQRRATPLLSAAAKPPAADATEAAGIATPAIPAVGQVDAAAASAKAALNELLWNGPRTPRRSKAAAAAAASASPAAAAAPAFELLPALIKLAKEAARQLGALLRWFAAVLAVGWVGAQAQLSSLASQAPGQMEVVGAAVLKLCLGLRLWVAALAFLFFVPATAAFVHGSAQRAQAEQAAAQALAAAQAKVKGGKVPAASAKGAKGAAAATGSKR